ncbi:MAG: glycosyltransferase [Desulfovibrio sp.]|jgi:glycosyltransferase involved in cell wall biosynthesis|nr:glycosyltransferase [Desulfovibrio sp.]
MRILFLHKTFPGSFRLLVHAFGVQPENTILFLSETGQKSARTNVRRLRLAPPLKHITRDSVENDLVQRYRRAARAGNALLLLSKDGYEPDLICASSSMPGSLFVRDVFPNAFYAIEADWFYRRGQQTFFNHDITPAEFAPARIRNLWEYNALGDCDFAFTSSVWQKSHYPDFLDKKLHVIHHGINTAFFSSVPEFFVDETTHLKLANTAEIVSFSGPYQDPSRGFSQFLQAVPQILSKRPNCHIIMLWPDRRSKPRQGGETIRREETEKYRQLLADVPLSDKARSRLHLLGVRPISKYRQMLRASTVHVYLTAPHALSTGFLEAMACGALVVGSDTAPVKEVLEHGKNGFLCDYAEPGAIAETVAGVLNLAPKLTFIREAAKQIVAQEYNAALQTERLVAPLREGVLKKRRNIAQARRPPLFRFH